MDGHDPADVPWYWYPDDDYAAAEPGMLGAYYYADDPLELAWQGGGAHDVGQPAAAVSSCQRSSSSSPSPPPLGATVTPSDDVMAAWLYPIVSGEDRAAGTGVDGSAQVPAAAGPSEPSMATGSFGAVKTESKGKLPSMEDRTRFSVVKGSANTRSVDDGSGERISRKQLPAATTAAAGGGSTSRTTRPSHHPAGTHSVTEKRRRCRITERLRTLQQLVPGCDKSNQASTLEQTIQYMKSLQQQLEAMKTTPPAAAVYPVVRPVPPSLAVTGRHQGSTVVAGGGAAGALHVRPAMAAAAAGTTMVPLFRGAAGALHVRPAMTAAAAGTTMVPLFRGPAGALHVRPAMATAAAGTTMVPLFRGAVLPYPQYYYYHHHAVMMPPPPSAAAPPPSAVAAPSAAHPAAAAAGDHGEVVVTRSSAVKTESPDGSDGSRGSEPAGRAAEVVGTSETTTD